MSQPDRPAAPARLPAGFRNAERLLDPREEQDLAREIEELSFTEIELEGFLGKRRVVPYGCVDQLGSSITFRNLIDPGGRRGRGR